MRQSFRDPEHGFALQNVPAPRAYNAQSLERGLFVLAYLRDAPQATLSLAEIAAGLALTKSTVHRLLTTLVRHGYAAQDPVTKRYRLGLAFLAFGHRVVEQLDVRRHALRVMRALAEETGEAVHLNVLAGTGALCVDEVVGPNGATLGSTVGVVLPVHSVATGKCFLAWMDEPERAALLDRLDFAPITDHTIRDRATLEAELVRVRQRGYAVNDEETYPGVRYVAAPIFDAHGGVVGAMSLGAPVIRAAAADLPRMGAQIQRAVERVSASLGYGPAPRAGTLRR
jgi:IclR family acetate operon transcriptional repressor